MSRPPRCEWTLVHAVRRQAELLGDRPFIRFEDGQSFTFRSLDQRTDDIAAALAALGVRPGDRVLGLIGNRAENICVMLGANKLGAVWVPVNTGLRGAFLQHQLHNAEPRVVVLEGSLVGNLGDVAPGPVPPVATVMVGDGPVPLPECLAASRRLEFAELDELAAGAGSGAAGGRQGSEGPDAEVVVPAVGDVAMIMYTSGTTGPSKGVLMPHGHCYVLGLGAAEATGLTADDRYFVCMPFFHANGLLMQFAACLIAGAGVVVAERFRASTWLEEVRASGATLTNGLGVIPEFIFRQPPTERDRDHQLRLMMAVPIAEEWGQAFEERFGVPFLQGFGMTECNMVSYSRPGIEPLEPGCAGYVLDEWFEVRIVDPASDEPRPQGEVGEIVVRPKLPGCFMAGYFRMPDRTVEAWRNLWFHTGDAGRFDGAGRLHYVDRLKDCIRRRGENISSFEIEQVLNAHPAVAESAVVGVKVAGAGGEDEVKAYVVPEAGAHLDPRELLDWCQPRMPHFAVPRFIEWVETLAKTPTGKLQKVALREAGVTVSTWDREAEGYIVRRR